MNYYGHQILKRGHDVRTYYQYTGLGIRACVKLCRTCFHVWSLGSLLDPLGDLWMDVTENVSAKKWALVVADDKNARERHQTELMEAKRIAEQSNKTIRNIALNSPSRTDK